jgi:hypothetical protein
MTPTTSTLPPELLQRLQDRAASHGLSVERYVETLIEKDAPRESDQLDGFEEAKRKFLSRTPEEIAAAREDALKSGHQARELPEGKTLFDVIEGTWPGDETDEEILAILEKLS